MKQLHTLLIYIYMTLTLTLTLTSCDGFQISKNGDLDGMWHLVETDTLYYGANFKVVDYTYNGVFWSVQSDLLRVENKKINSPIYLFRFKHDGRILKIYDPYKVRQKPYPEEKVEDPTELSPLGINKLEETFSIDRLDSKKMILVGESLKLVFIRY